MTCNVAVSGFDVKKNGTFYFLLSRASTNGKEHPALPSPEAHRRHGMPSLDDVFCDRLDCDAGLAKPLQRALDLIGSAFELDRD